MRNVEVFLPPPPAPSFRVQQVSGMFDDPPEWRLGRTLRAELPDAGDTWDIGCIVGPSGSGKSTLAKHAFGSCYSHRLAWDDDRPFLDVLPGDLGIHELMKLLYSVGLSSLPSWTRTYSQLSEGEKCRADLARWLSAPTEGKANQVIAVQNDARPIVVVDEFTSPLDRLTARTTCLAIARAIRSRSIPRRLVAVTCHEDVRAWLAADWTFDAGDGTLAWGGLRRQRTCFEVHAASRSAWTHFAPHHYLSAKLPATAECLIAFDGDRPAAFAAVVGLYGRKGCKRICRLVTLPEFQGIGLGSRMCDATAEHFHRLGWRMSITATHPAVLSHCRRSPRWRCLGWKGAGASQNGIPARGRQPAMRIKSSGPRAIMTFGYCSQAKP